MDKVGSRRAWGFRTSLREEVSNAQWIPTRVGLAEIVTSKWHFELEDPLAEMASSHVSNGQAQTPTRCEESKLLGTTNGR
jgi:hypothetical protein